MTRPAPPAGFAHLLTGLVLVGLALSGGGLAGQTEPAAKVRKEDEEAAKSPKTPKVPRVEDEETPRKALPKVPLVVGDEPAGSKSPAPKAPVDVGGPVNLRQEAEKAALTPVKEFYKALTIPYDLLVLTNNVQHPIALLPNREPPPTDELEYVELNATLTAGTNKKIATGQIGKLVYFEDFALTHVDTWLKRDIPKLSRFEQLEAAARGLTATIRFHEAAREQNKRIGKGWDPVLARLRTRLLEVRREEVQTLEDARQPRQAEGLAQALLGQYPGDPVLIKALCRLRLSWAAQMLGGTGDEEFLRLRETLTEFERQTGAVDDPVATEVRKRLRAKAEEHVSRAKDLAGQNQTAAALARLRIAEALDPEAAGIRDVRGRLKGSVLYVGVPRLPERLAPVTARTDAERWAVELVFESLLEQLPDFNLGRSYRPLLAAGLPEMAPLGREFHLRRGVRWCEVKNGRPVAGEQLDARDVRGTLATLLDPKLAGTWAADGLDVLDAKSLRLEDPFRLRVPFNQGVLEPLGRMTFKVLPAEQLRRGRREADDDEFAREPFGTGPYYYAGREVEGAGREVAVFRVNPYYGQGGRLSGPPQIPEIRFCVLKNTAGASTDFEAGQLHLLPDVPSADFVRFSDNPALRGRVKVYTTHTNRRIYLLAVNQREPALRSAELRRGLALALDREAILNSVFRPEGTKFHRALTGPFPPGAWATPPKSPPLFKPELARTLFAEAAKGGQLRLSLKYATDDPQALAACKLIKEQVEKAAGTGVTIDLVPPPEKAGEVKQDSEALRKLVEQGHTYELAYWSFDYRDDLFRLDGLLDPSAGGRHGRNFLGYLLDDTGVQEGDRRLRQALEDVRSHRDFCHQVKEKTWEVHTLFNQQVPFVPLWQLDRHLVVANNVEINIEGARPPVTAAAQIDPAVLFTDVTRWRLNTGP